MQNLNEVATLNAVETVNAAVAANVEQANEQTCCPKAKSTVLAVIEGGKALCA